MAKAWRIVLVFVLIAAIIGAVLMLVGLMTGSDFTRMFHTVADKYGLVDDAAVYVDYFGKLFGDIRSSLPIDELIAEYSIN